MSTTTRVVQPARDKPLLAGGLFHVFNLLVANYVVTMSILAFLNVPPLGAAFAALAHDSLAVRVMVGLMGGLSAITFFMLLVLCLYHFSRGYIMAPPPATWFWVIILLNFVGIAVYWYKVMLPEYRAWHRIERAT